jgi:Skp family chaperone for outer membrane proteins
MVVSSRKILPLGVGLLAAITLAGPAFGQAPAQDGGLRKTASQTQAAPAAAADPAVPKPVTAVFGTVDVEKVFKDYDKVKTQQEEFKAAALARQNELLKIQSEAQEEANKLQKMTPNSVDARKIEERLTELKAKLEAGRESAQRDFALRESEMLATLYKEVQDMVRRIAVYRGMTYVVQVSTEPISGTNPNSVMAAMAKTVVYADPQNDITRDVVYNLNRAYQAAGGTAPRAAAAPAAGARPSGN